MDENPSAVDGKYVPVRRKVLDGEEGTWGGIKGHGTAQDTFANAAPGTPDMTPMSISVAHLGSAFFQPLSGLTATLLTPPARMPTTAWCHTQRATGTRHRRRKLSMNSRLRLEHRWKTGTMPDGVTTATVPTDLPVGRRTSSEE